MEKASFGKFEGVNYAVKVDCLDTNSFYLAPFGRQLSDLRKLNQWIKTAKQGYASCKTKKTNLAGVKEFIKLYQPKEFYATWKQTEFYKDDSVLVFYTK